VALPLQNLSFVPRPINFPKFVLLSLFLCATLALAYISFERKVESFTQVDFVARVTRGSIEVVSVPASSSAASVLRENDRIVLVDGSPVASSGNPVRNLSSPPFPHRLAVVRGGEVLPALLGRPPTRVDLPYLFLAFVGILYLLIGLATFSRERTATSLLFVAFCVSSFAIDLLTPSGPIDSLWKTLWLAEDFFRAVAPALLMHFFLLFPQPMPRWRRLAGLLYVPPVIYLAGEVLISLPRPPVEPASLPFAVELLERFWLVYFAAYGAAAVVRIASASRTLKDVSSQRQARWIALGCALGLVPFFLLYDLPRALGYRSTWAACAGVIPLVFVPLGFAYAILRWRLWDVDIFAREILATTASVFLGAAGFVLINSLLNKTLGEAASGAKNFLAFGSGLFLASLLVPVKRRFSIALERIQYGESYRARRALLDFSRESRGLHDVESLADALSTHVREALRTAPCRVFLFDRNLPPGISAEALRERLSQGDVARIRSSTFPSGEDLTFLRLSQDGFHHLFAVKSGGRLIGALAVGLKEEGVPLSTEDVALLSTVMSQAALAFENAELYRELEKRMEETVQRERLASLGVLAAGVAHEVNTPLAGISSYAQMLLADTDRADPRYDILKKMERQTFRASRLVHNLLEFARGRHGAHETFDLASTLRDALESAETELSARGLRVTTRGVDGPLPAKGCAREIEQVFVNLLINARDASPQDGEIAVAAEAKPEKYVVSVSDRGKGITEEEARRAFEPFFTTRTAGGTGLGLAICREIIERHGGTISLSPRPGGGAVATVGLPR
jgi:signal transduction histidine kinase